MIVTVTLNPSLDRTVEVDKLARGTVIRATAARLDPGGKGVNVSRALRAFGVPSRAIVPCGGDEGSQLIRLLEAEGVEVQSVPIAGRTRSNITLAEPDGTTTKINEPGPELTQDELEAITQRVLDSADGATWIVLCGSMPPGLTVTSFALLCSRLAAAGYRLAVDTSGPALPAAAMAGAALLKPNREELAAAVGFPLTTLDEVTEAAQRLRTLGAGAVLASLGADGAVLIDGGGIISGESPVAQPRSSVGAGDALLAGFLAAETAKTAGSKRANALAQGLTWAAAAVRLPGSRMPGPDDLRPDEIHIHESPHTVS